MDTKIGENKRDSKRTRRRFSLATKKQMVAETLKDGASVSLVARRYNVNTNQLFKWRNLLQDELLGRATTPAPALIPIQLSTPVATTPRPRERTTTGSELEIRLRDGHQLTLRGAVDTEALRIALEVLSR